MDLLDLTATQHSAFSRDQARDLGLSDGQLRHLIDSRVVERAAPSVFRLRGVPPSWRQRVMVATLSVPGSMASHRAAARLWDLDGFESAPVEILVVRGRRRRRAPRSSILHETMDLKAGDIDDRHGIRCTSLVRTLVDLPAVAHEFKAGVALDQAIREHPPILPRVGDRHREVARRGRNGCAALRDLLAERGVGDLVDSGFERRALRLIGSSCLPRPVTQHQVVDGDSGGDFNLCPRAVPKPPPSWPWDDHQGGDSMGGWRWSLEVSGQRDRTTTVPAARSGTLRRMGSNDAMP